MPSISNQVLCAYEADSLLTGPTSLPQPAILSLLGVQEKKTVVCVWGVGRDAVVIYGREAAEAMIS